MIRRPPRSTLDRSSAASDVYKRQPVDERVLKVMLPYFTEIFGNAASNDHEFGLEAKLSLIHISEPTRPY